MEAKVNMTMTPQELNLITRALTTEIEACDEIVDAQGYVAYADTDPAEVRAARARRVQVNDLLKKLQ